MELNLTSYAKQIAQDNRDRVNESLASLIGCGVGAGVFLMIVILGVVFWISQERDEDEVVRMEAAKCERGKRGGLLIEPVEKQED